MRKILSASASVIVIAVLMFTAALSVSAKERSGKEPDSDISWTVSDDGVLTISGTGDPKNYDREKNRPGWYKHKGWISKVIISEGVTSISDNMLADLYSGLNIKVPASVVKVSAEAFADSGSPSFIVDKNNQNLTDVDGILYSKDMKTLIRYPRYKTGVFELPESVERIEKNAFNNARRIRRLTITANVKSVGERCFYGARDMHTIRFECDIDAIGDSMFKGCSELKKVVLPKNIKTIGYAAFFGCKKLENIKIPSAVTKIGDNAFYNCKALPNIKLSSKLTSIGDSAFYGCKKMTEIKLPETVKSIGNNAFSQCTALEKVEFSKKLKKIGDGVFTSCANLKSVDLSKTKVETIGERAFINCKRLVSAKLPNTVKSLGKCAFMMCPKLKSVKLSKGLTKISASLFESCDKLDEVKIPGSVKKIEKFAFAYCCNLTDIEIHDKVRSIGAGAFSGCEKLKKLRLPLSLEKIGKSAFRNTAVERVVLPSGIKGIPSYAFSECENLKSVSIPNGVTSIGDGVFDACPKLKTLSVPKSVKKIGAKAYGFDFAAEKRISGCKIYGVKGSAAQKYAKNNGIKFSTLEKTPTVKISKSKFSCTGKNIRPTVAVKDSKGNTLKEGRDYIVVYPESSKSVSKYSVTVGFIGKYAGVKTMTYKIVAGK